MKLKELLEQKTEKFFKLSNDKVAGHIDVGFGIGWNYLDGFRKREIKFFFPK